MSDKPSKYKLSLEATKFSKRVPSWLLFVGILLLFLAIPMLSLLSDNSRDDLRNSPLPSDNAWISGALSTPHQLPQLNQNCEVCHVNAFEMVQDDTCLSCHADTNHHFDTDQHDTSVLAIERCATCHREHDEPSNTVRQDDKLCVSCHSNMSNTLETVLRDVDGFGQEQMRDGLEHPHPSFRVSMLHPQGKQDALNWSLRRVDLSSQPVEQSNLVFPHDIHMSPEGIESPEGVQVLQCNSCHVNEDSGMLMQPVTMENNCRACHSLVFDKAAPDREVPHGDPDKVLLTLEEYYSRQFLWGSLGRDPTPQEVREFMLRRPGKNVQARADQTLNLASPWGKALSVAEEIFERTTCKTCHEVSIDESDRYLSKWRVNPIRLTAKWMPKSEFNHFKHRTFDCASCHAASSSSSSSDVLMPDLANCQSCHTGARTHESKIPSTCISCHQFHLPEEKAWAAEVYDHQNKIKLVEQNSE